MRQLDKALRTGNIAQFVAAEMGQPHALREVVEHEFLGGGGQHGLSAVGQVAHPAGPVDGGADVVALVAKLYLAGVQADPQLDRCQRSALQLEGACHGIAGSGECDHEAVAFTLFDGSDPMVGADDGGQGGVQPGYRGGHLFRLGLPKTGRTLDIGQQQRHRSGRQVAHAQVAPVHRHRVHAPIRFAHVSQHGAPGRRKHQQKCVQTGRDTAGRNYALWPMFFGAPPHIVR